MEVKAQLNFLRMGPRKVRLVTNLLKKKTIGQALEQLKFLPRASSRPVAKLIQAAAANAENNWQLKKDNLLIKNIIVNSGPTLPRWRPRAFGRATPIRKRSSHIILILEEIAPTASPQAKRPRLAPAAQTVTLEEAKEAKAAEKKAEEVGRRPGKWAGFRRKIFSRKTG